MLRTLTITILVSHLSALYHKMGENATVTKISFAIMGQISYNYKENQEVRYAESIRIT